MVKIIDKARIEKNPAEAVISTLRSRDTVGNTKKGVSLLSILQKLSQKREKISDEKATAQNHGTLLKV